MSDGIARFKDFTGNTEPIQFQIRDQIFTCNDDIPIGRIGELSKLISGDDTENMAEKMLALFRELLVLESFQRFESSVMTGSPVNIGVSRIKEIIPWLLEQYGLRPTEPSSGSVTT